MQNNLTEDELKTLVKLSKKILWASPNERKRLQAEKINIIPANFYSDIPLISDIENSFEYRDENETIYNSNVFKEDSIRQFIERISIYASEFEPPLSGNIYNPDGFFWTNPAFTYTDAMAYYCVLRHFRPQHILEIGSGFSTLVANEALKKNGSGNITLIEPYPKEFLFRLETVNKIIQKDVQNIPLSKLINLVENSDIWFIDSTHTVKIGSDCLYIYLKVMPEIKKNIIIHSHDISLPFGISQKNALEKHIYWTEQYLLYAYLLDNPKTDVLFGTVYAGKVLPKETHALMLNKYPVHGGSLWYRLNGEKPSFLKRCKIFFT